MRLFPWARIVTVIPVLFFPFFFELPALVVMGFWFAVQVLNGAGALFMTSAGGGIAYWAHIGGFLAGLLFGPLCVRALYPQPVRTQSGGGVEYLPTPRQKEA